MMTMTREQIRTFPYGNLGNFIYLGDDHWYAFTYCGPNCLGEGTHGILQPHWTNGRWCGGSCTFEGHGDYANWSLINDDPLHLDPSFLCKGCGDNGFIRNGRWDAE